MTVRLWRGVRWGYWHTVARLQAFWSGAHGLDDKERIPFGLAKEAQRCVHTKLAVSHRFAQARRLRRVERLQCDLQRRDGIAQGE